MRALHFTGPATDAATSTVTEVTAPTPGADQVAIRVAWAGVNFKDVMQRRGDPGYVDSYPFIPGLEVSGTVTAVGPGVGGHIVGNTVTAVTGQGGLAEVVVAHRSLIATVPNDLDLRVAASAPGALTSAALLVDTFGRVRAGDVLMVHSAAGAVGAAVAQLARHRGATRLIGVVGAASRVSAAHANGYDDVFVRGEYTGNEIKDRLNGARADLILDPLGTTMLEFDLDLAHHGTKIIIYGNAGGAPLADPPKIPILMGRGVQIGGFSLAAMMAGEPLLVTSTMGQVLHLLRDGVLTPSLTTVPDLSDVPIAHDALAAGTGEGKYVVQVS